MQCHAATLLPALAQWQMTYFGILMHHNTIGPQVLAGNVFV